jgi:hypothetical protein
MLVGGELLGPPIFLVGITLLLRNRLSHRIGFAVAGGLLFYGVLALVTGVAIRLPVPMIGKSMDDRILNGIAVVQVRSLAVAILAIVPLLVWLYHVLKRPA